MSIRQPQHSMREDGVRRGHTNEAIKWNAKAARNKNGRPEEAAGSQRLKGGDVRWNYGAKAGHYGLKALNLTNKGTGNVSCVTGTEGDQDLN